MQVLRVFLNGLDISAQGDFARRCGTSLGYLRKAISVGRGVGAEIAIAAERESGGILKCEDLCPGPDWAHIRATKKLEVTKPARVA